jgi:endonuclease G
MKTAEIPLDARDPSRQSLETKCAVTEPVRAPVDLDYSNRQGFDECFIGIDVGLPEVAAAGRRIHPGGATNETASILRYAHFSIAMNPSRKLAYYVAVNIDGARSIDLGPRGDDVWIFDERIPEEQQIGNWLYDDNDFDRGHLVRRLDPVWGDSREEALRAEADTFHFTNCAPQHWRFNRRREFWQGIESYILDNVSLHDLRISLFTGPVLADDDPEMEGTRVPRGYWKLVAMRKQDGSLATAAYILSQAELLRVRPEEFVFGEYKTFQVSVSELETRTRLNFGELRRHDSLARLRRERGVEAPERIELQQHEQMIV